jgi:hypothetical protein
MVSSKLDKEKQKIKPIPTSGLVGWKCIKDGERRDFDACYLSCPYSDDRCEPLPLLVSLGSNRPVVPFTYSVTEILQPPQVVYLSRNNVYYSTPDSLIASSLGTAWHSTLERARPYIWELGLEEEYLMEQSFSKEYTLNIGKDTHLATLTGRSDLYVTSTKTLWDYKTMKYWYALKYLIAGKWEDSTYHWQLNMYRVFQYPEAEKMKIEAVVKDYKLNFPELYGIKETHKLDVPFIEDKVIKATAKELLTTHVTNQLDPSKVRKCAADELWVNKDGIPLRCKHYCPVADLCSQGQGYLGTSRDDDFLTEGG